MQTLQMIASQGARPDPMRAYAHDLRNLFAVVASAKFLLERPHDEGRLELIIDALGRVAADGKIVTNALLARETSDRGSGIDATSELQGLASSLAILQRPGLSITLDVAPEAAWVFMPAADFAAVVLELIMNAARAGSRTIRIRSAQHGGRFWLIAADDGCGFTAGKVLSASSMRSGLHGTGLRRLASAVSTARGKLKIRSRPGRGTSIAIILPTARIVAMNEPAERRTWIWRSHGQRIA